MKALALVGLVGVAGCDVALREPPQRWNPWITGLSHVVTTDHGSDGVAKRMRAWSPAPDRDCVSVAYPGFELSANVAAAPGDEAVLASYAQGIVVLDAEDRLIASTAGFGCRGSRDDLELLAAGDVYGDQTIVLVATGGGRVESSTWVTLFRVADHRIDAVFTGTVEVRRGERIRRGGVALMPDSLIYTRPGGKPQLYIYDPVGRAYLVPGEELEPTDHDGPMISSRYY